MLASDLVECLTRLIEKHGDHPVGFADEEQVHGVAVVALAGHDGGDDVAFLLGDEALATRARAAVGAVSG